MDLKTYPDREMMMMSVADRIAGELRMALQSHDRVSLAVPGGTTPGLIFDTLSAVDLDWDRVTVILSDERWVPEDAPRSNARLVREHLLVDKAAAAHFVPYWRAGVEMQDALDAASEEIAPLLPLSVLVLGMGADMHLASLFPGADRLDTALAQDAPPLIALTAPGAPEPRITLTAPALRGAMSTHLVITGPEKRAALDKAARLDDPAAAPVSIILKTARVHWAE